VEDKFYNEEFDVVVANPPYGVSWKGYQKDINNDKTGRFKFLPSVSDGQLLFMQHLISKLDAVGMGVVVHNGSTLFSGDAGSAESNIRKWMLDSDIVEAVIQLPTDEFFNTGIYTYLWVLNKNKQPVCKDKVMLINASEKFKPLKKSKGSKRKEVDEASRLEIVETLTKYQNNDYARVFDKEFFYFNKQAIMLTNVDEYGNSFETKLKEGKKSEKLTPSKLTNGERELTEFVITAFDSTQYESLSDAFAQDIKPFIASLDYKEQPLVVTTAVTQYWYDAGQETLIEEVNGKKECLGCGKIVVKSSFKKASKKQPERIEISVELTPDHQKDYEIIPFHKDEAANQAGISDFMAKYITKPFTYLENVVGVELNFNKIFYKPEKLREVVDILAEIDALDGELKELEAGLAL
jgi:type I restriction enzyme M protein